MPAGTLTVQVRLRFTRPVPKHLGHLSWMTLPVPPQVEQVRTVTIKPPCTRTWPVPLQVGQVLG